jgi:hypothetical protein
VSKIDDRVETINTVSGCNRKNRLAESDSDSDSESSIHTSDMSSDEDDVQEVDDEQDIADDKDVTASGYDEKMSEDTATRSVEFSEEKTVKKKKMIEHKPVVNIPLDRDKDIQASYSAFTCHYISTSKGRLSVFVT